MGSGSVLPVGEVAMSGDDLELQLTSGKPSAPVIQKITAKCVGDELKLTMVTTMAKGVAGEGETFSGHRIAPLPPRPDLSKVVVGPAIDLLAGDLETTWQMVDPKAPSGWSLKDGVLANRVPPGKHPRLGNLRTKAIFEDSRVTTEFRTLPGSNSGVYLRGIYEIQVAETYGKPLDSHNMGALYSRIAPTVAAEKPAGEWQTLEITLVDRHISVVLNGTTIIDNQPVLGCTGGALTSDESKPGPLMLQGDHSDIDYRNLRIFPIRK